MISAIYNEMAEHRQIDREQIWQPFNNCYLGGGYTNKEMFKVVFFQLFCMLETFHHKKLEK